MMFYFSDFHVFYFIIIITTAGPSKSQPRSSINFDYLKQGRDWPGLCSSGKRQSPVRLSLDSAELDESLGPIEFSYSDETFGSYSNNGHTITFNINETLSEKSFISGGGLDATYQFYALHFHWGLSNNEGSEHVINKTRSPFEMHLVHFNTRYDSFEEAQPKSDGLAAIAVLFDVAVKPRATSKLSRFLFAELPFDNSDLFEKSVFKKVAMSKYAAEIETAKFFRYEGSLTTPPCFESVTWTVIRRRFDVSADLMAQFREVELLTADGSTMMPLANYRALQKLSGRVVYAN